MKLALCPLTGQLRPGEDVNVFRTPPLSGDGLTIIQYFITGVMIAIVAAMVLLRPAAPPKPFSLPGNLVPSRIVPRVLAALIDLVPFSVVSTAIVLLPRMTIDQMQEAVAKSLVTPDMAYANIACLVPYALYGAFMEYRYGATLGKMVFKLRVVADDSRRPGPREVALRNLTKIFELMLLSFLPLLPFVVLIPLITRYRQRIGDMFARTAVISISDSSPPADDNAPPRPKESAHQRDDPADSAE